MSMTPVRNQYLKVKQAHPEAIVLFRLGDFYETFEDDARLVARELEITLTSREMGRGQRFPMAGIPYHALDNYLARLLARGHKVAICEQMSEPGRRGLMEREVVRVVTPGTIVEPHLLEGKSHNYLAALAVDGELAGLAYVDITTSEFATCQLPAARVGPELDRLRPAELLLPPDATAPPGCQATRLEAEAFAPEPERLLAHFQVASLEGYGCAGLPFAIRAAGAILYYLAQTQKAALGQITSLATYSTEEYMTLDAATRRNLELFQSSRWGSARGSLLAILDLTRTSMGGRLLRTWLGQPLLDLQKVRQRQEGVAAFHGEASLRAQMIALLSSVADLERLATRCRLGIATPRELVALRRSLETLPRLRELLEEQPGLTPLAPSACPELAGLIARAVVDEPPSSLADGGVVRAGFFPELDELRSSAQGARRYLADLERTERDRTGIRYLKVGYNKIFGYYLEVTTPHLPQVPADYIRKQTLAGAERFFTPELKEYEALILNSQERIAELEAQAFRQVLQQVAASGERVLEVARRLATLDVLAALAEAAVRYGYVRPDVDEGAEIVIKGGRHPVVERVLEGDGFVPNDVRLSNADAQLIILTGPNMAGKSTYLRQVALIVLLAQTGSFVPAESARIGLVDRIFTRVGLQDDLALGQSTFMVEMTETASILNNATSRSLIILDEIGRGTSTYDGLSIARAVAEYLHNHPRLGAKTVFATHYHELTELARVLPRARNLHMAVAEEDGKVIFLRRVLPGGADRSYGIHVAQLAGLPRAVVQRAQQVLSELETNHPGGQRLRHRTPQTPRSASGQGQQLPLLGEPHPVLQELKEMEVAAMTPLEAITKLFELQQKARQQT